MSISSHVNIQALEDSQSYLMAKCISHYYASVAIKRINNKNIQAHTHTQA